MKNILLYLSLCASMIGNCQLTAIPDPCFEYNLIVQGLDIGPVDGYVSTSSIDTITYLHLNAFVNGGIYDMTGIEDFVSLEEIWVIDHNITSLDLSGSPNLRKVRCLYNQLQTVNFTNNPKLEELECYANNIETLDLSMNPKLTFLKCFTNQLYCLNLKNGNNINMPDFSLGNNWSNVLTCVQVDDPEWSAANWSGLASWTSFSKNCYNECSHDDLIDDSYSSFLIYPNPNEGVFKLDFRTEDEGAIEIVDATGRLALRLIIQPYIDNNFDLELSSGVYLISVKVGDLKLTERMVVN
ncbi:MAG: hypothetical protein ACJAUD_000820 [Crocinitomicaceae bacterium]|jgi:hypothetical protein